MHGLVFFSFPLHQPGKPDTKRAEHLAAVTVPMLFLSGTRDELADLDLLKPVCKKLGKRRDAPRPGHGRPRLQGPQAIPRASDEDVFVEMARVVRDWATRLG